MNLSKEEYLEIIDCLRSCARFDNKTFYHRFTCSSEALTRHLDALQELVEKSFGKETPKKPLRNKLDKGLYTCPTCVNACLEEFAPNGRNTNNYCYNCGQKLDWSDFDVD